MEVYESFSRLVAGRWFLTTSTAMFLVLLILFLRFVMESGEVSCTQEYLDGLELAGSSYEEVNPNVGMYNKLHIEVEDYDSLKVFENSDSLCITFVSIGSKRKATGLAVNLFQWTLSSNEGEVAFLSLQDDIRCLRRISDSSLLLSLFDYSEEFILNKDEGDLSYVVTEVALHCKNLQIISEKEILLNCR